MFPDADLGAIDRIVKGARLTSLDAAFAHALYHAAITRWLTLEFLIQRHLSQPFVELEPRLRAAMLGGAAQIVFMDRVPAHAAINHAVEWCKRIIRPGAGALANAVLRKVAASLAPEESRIRPSYTPSARDELPLADGRSLVLAESCVPDDEAHRLSVATSHPRSLLDHWLKTRSLEQVRALALHSLCSPPTVLNTMHAQGTIPPNATAAHSVRGHSIFTGADLPAFLADHPSIWVQDSASSQAVASVVDLSPKVVLDLCAGQGTKTRQIAQTFPGANVVATDIDPVRLETLGRVFADHDRVRVLPLAELRAEYLGRADLILLDVPCSNTGVLPRRPEARYRFDSKSLQSLIDVQRQIIADAIPLLAPGSGSAILYSTCSLEPEENHAQAAWAVRWHRFKRSHERSAEPAGFPGGAPADYRDGSYSVLLST